MIRAASPQAGQLTSDTTHEEIVREMEQRISYYAAHPDEINQRLWELDSEWDIDRVLSAGVSGLALLGLVAGRLRSRRWLLVPAVVSGLVLQYALRGGSPIVPALRQLGIRTRQEIDQERYALKVLRGDFQLGDLEGHGDLQRVAMILESVLRQ